MTETISKPPNLWGKTADQDWREQMRSRVEKDTKMHQNQLRMKRQFTKGSVEELILRYELSVLLDERLRNQVVERIDLMDVQKTFGFDMQFIRQNADFITARIQKSLSSVHHLFVDKGQIEEYLLRVDMVFKAKLAAGEPIDAIPYIGQYDTLDEFGNINQKAKTPKQGRARPIVFMGKIYSSIRAAHQDNPSFSYNSIQKYTLRQAKKAIAFSNEVMSA